MLKPFVFQGLDLRLISPARCFIRLIKHAEAISSNAECDLVTANIQFSRGHGSMVALFLQFSALEIMILTPVSSAVIMIFI